MVQLNCQQVMIILQFSTGILNIPGDNNHTYSTYENWDHAKL